MIPSIRITNQGVEAPTREEVQAGLWEVLEGAFGAGLTRDDRTPQGQLVTSLSAIITDRDNATIELANNFDPRYARGVFQAALGEIYFITPRGATASIVQLEFMGIEGAEQPAGTHVIDDNGMTWITLSDAIANVNGVAVTEAACDELGAVTAAPGTITTILDPATGIDRVTNPASAVEGYNEEVRAQFEQRRAASVAKNGKGLAASVFGEVSDLPEVIDAYAIDNPTDESITVGATDYPMIRNSLLVSVVGGDSQEIAKAILTKGGTGCAFVGNTEVEYLDEENFDINPPSYIVRFVRPTHVRMYVRVTIDNFDQFTGQLLTQTRIAILSQAKPKIASTIYASRLACNIPSELNVVSVELSRDNESWVDVESFGVDEIPTFADGDISVSPL